MFICCKTGICGTGENHDITANWRSICEPSRGTGKTGLGLTVQAGYSNQYGVVAVLGLSGEEPPTFGQQGDFVTIRADLYRAMAAKLFCQATGDHLPALRD